jgi:hypothetical protein
MRVRKAQAHTRGLRYLSSISFEGLIHSINVSKDENISFDEPIYIISKEVLTL